MYENYYSATLPNYAPGESLPKSTGYLSVIEIEDAVCTFFGLHYGEVRSKRKEQPVLKAKQIFRFLLSDQGLSYRQIARICGVSHSAVKEGIVSVQGYLDVSDPYIQDIWAIKGALRA